MYYSMAKQFYLLLLILILFCNLSVSSASLKKQQVNQLFDIYQTHHFTFFCEQAFQSDGYLILPRCKSCPNTPSKIQWMPIVPLQRLASPLSCYRDKPCLDKSGKRYGGLRCCQKTDPFYIRMSSDLYNYVPENPTISRLRGQYVFSEFQDVEHSHSGCHFYIDRKRKRLSPAPNTRGIIARTYLYFHQQYQLSLSQEELNLFKRWNQAYPISEWERKRSQLIFEQQDTINLLSLHF